MYFLLPICVFFASKKTLYTIFLRKKVLYVSIFTRINYLKSCFLHLNNSLSFDVNKIIPSISIINDAVNSLCKLIFAIFIPFTLNFLRIISDFGAICLQKEGNVHKSNILA